MYYWNGEFDWLVSTLMIYGKSIITIWFNSFAFVFYKSYKSVGFYIIIMFAVLPSSFLLDSIVSLSGCLQFLLLFLWMLQLLWPFISLMLQFLFSYFSILRFYSEIGSDDYYSAGGNDDSNCCCCYECVEVCIVVLCEVELPSASMSYLTAWQSYTNALRKLYISFDIFVSNIRSRANSIFNTVLSPLY